MISIDVMSRAVLAENLGLAETADGIATSGVGNEHSAGVLDGNVVLIVIKLNTEAPCIRTAATWREMSSTLTSQDHLPNSLISVASASLAKVVAGAASAAMFA